MDVDRSGGGVPSWCTYARQTVDVDGHELAYIDEGTGPPVVVVHGNPTWGFGFRSLIEGLSSSHRVIVPDHVGMGRSAHPSASDYSYTLQQRILDLTSLIDQVVPYGPVDLVLHDWGGAIGCGWATEHPDRLGRLLLINTAAFPLPPGQRLPWTLRLARSRVGSVVVRDLGLFNLGALLVGARRRLPAPVVRGYLAPYRSRAQREAVLAFVRDIPLGPGDPAWQPLLRMAERLEVLHDHPVTICWGMKDPVFTAALLDEWRKRLPRARIIRFPNAGHLVHEDAPARIVTIAREAFAGSLLP